MGEKSYTLAHGKKKQYHKLELTVIRVTVVWRHSTPVQLNKNFSSKFPGSQLQQILNEGHKMQRLKPYDDNRQDEDPR